MSQLISFIEFDPLDDELFQLRIEIKKIVKDIVSAKLIEKKIGYDIGATVINVFGDKPFDERLFCLLRDGVLSIELYGRENQYFYTNEDIYQIRPEIFVDIKFDFRVGKVMSPKTLNKLFSEEQIREDLINLYAEHPEWRNPHK